MKAYNQNKVIIIHVNKTKTNWKNESQIEKSKTTKTLIEWWNWKQKQLTKRSRKKIQNQKNKEWNEKNMKNYNWRTKLKKKTYMKGIRMK
jgi:hypothetical protein